MSETEDKGKNKVGPAGQIRTIFVEETCTEMVYTKEILGRAGAIPQRIVSEREFSNLFTGENWKNLTQGKRNLLLCKNKGKFFKPCPGTKEYTCCDYQVLNVGMNCPMDCVYCILQAYLNNPWLSFFVNVDDMLYEVSSAIAREPSRFLRIGTGEFTDSLALDSLTALSPILIEFMRDKPNTVLELKTKTAEIRNLREADHGGRSIVSWSLNSPAIVVREELHTASLKERLTAAALCVSWGYRVAFHFDPIIYHEDWQKGYGETIDMLFDIVPPESIVWISLGCLRFLPGLKTISGERFSSSRIFYEEFIEGLDGKYRYFRSLRVEMYRFLAKRLTEKISQSTCIYLCMESNEIWQEVFGFDPEEFGGLSNMLDRAAFRT